jgi:hypothetical protein
MKLNNSKTIKNIVNQNPKNIDSFWEDCYKELPLEDKITFKKSIINKKSNDKKLINKYIKKIDYKNKGYEQNKSGFLNKCYNKLKEKIPNLYKEEQNNNIKKLKIKNSLKRSLLLYSYGLEVLKANKANIFQNEKNKEQEELKLCTWKPKLNNYRKISQKTISNKKKIKENKIKKIQEIKIDDECIFQPEINKNPNLNLEKVFNRSKSMFLYTDRGNTSFILRYKKARDEYMIKRIKKLSEKDDSFNSSFIDLTSRAIDDPYKNYLNVNTNMQIYNVLKKNENKNNRSFNFSPNNNSNLSKSNSKNNIIIPNVNKSKKYYVGLLKKQLRLIDLEI